jgi:hypothetical protein
LSFAMSRTHPMRKNPTGGPDRIRATSPRKVRAPGQSGAPPLGEPLEWTGQDQAGTGDEIVFPQHEVGGEIVGGPAVEQGGMDGPSSSKRPHSSRCSCASSGTSPTNPQSTGH